MREGRGRLKKKRGERREERQTEKRLTGSGEKRGGRRGIRMREALRAGKNELRGKTVGRGEE